MSFCPSAKLIGYILAIIEKQWLYSFTFILIPLSYLLEQ